jgi:dipeptidyl aminopeptidase/acylaminoacyl peptidase
MAIAPYGSWKSPITLDALVEESVGVGFTLATAHYTYWMELRPNEGGRTVLVRRPNDGGPEEDVFGAGFHCRTLVHEYGGIAFTVGSDDTVYFSNFADQRLYRHAPGAERDPEAITPEPPHERSVRYAAPLLSPDGRFLVAVRERHPEPDVPAEVVNDLVLIRTDSAATDGAGGGEPVVIAEGHDFFGQPALSPDGRRVAWTSWDHPNMPWDDTELYEAELGIEGRSGEPRRVAGGGHESVVQPKYSPDGRLHFISDRTGWWNLYAEPEGGGAAEPVAPMEADLGRPDWVFGTSSYDFVADGSVIASWSEAGLGRLGRLVPGGSRFDPIETDLTSFDLLRASADRTNLVAVAGSAASSAAVVRIRPEPAGAAAIEVVKASRGATIDPSYLSLPEPVEFPTEGGLTAHALYYAPRNPDFDALAGELPPLIVRSHGGPTSAASSVLNYGIQFWTTRGFAVVDVNYGGSTGFGREYRNRLRGNWGVVDLDDCVNAARFLAGSGRADPARLLIHGGSAGGYTTLCALTFRDVFAAGASYFGVADAGVFARDTHKFESRYLDLMIGPWPEAQAVYEERSPIFHTDKLRTPMILFQGLEDKIVPPEQAEAMAAALADKGVPYAYIAYEGEQHGFRKAENVKRTSEAELYFYGRVLGFTPADDLEPVTIENESAIGRG